MKTNCVKLMSRNICKHLIGHSRSNNNETYNVIDSKLFFKPLIIWSVDFNIENFQVKIGSNVGLYNFIFKVLAILKLV